ncbi:MULTISPECIES: DsbA family oxidoreductase [Olivibacter]|jgi:protein disulfide-isomerase|uniref:DsbA family oxidoreductase n=1 Tax=Olivibacter oleidegradans TaxID=760123 RepID=A0ABV6HS47_9SPHI|nr:MULTISPECIES: DsbA family oxidoreductase [unclassified Olivibacter]MDM8176361.1 DsbA family oxidoreductase [Olivibacter sp. 47]QEL01173.1 DsbA family oxidoreductase [Olivibacter sp. LS-1]
MNTNQSQIGPKMRIEIWSDMMCPFCYIGKRHYEAAVKQFAEQDKLEIIWKSFQLDPTIPEQMDIHPSVYQYLAERKGISYAESKAMHSHVINMAKEAGLEYNLDDAIVSNSFKAHRIMQFAKTKGLGDAAEEQLFKAYFGDGRNLSDSETLIEIGKVIGLTEAEIQIALTDDIYAYRVHQDIREAKDLGIRGVPFFLFNQKHGVSGAQPSDVFLQTLEQSFKEWQKTNAVD